MPSTYVLIEQSELHDFLHDLEGLTFWATKMAGLSTSITAPAPLGIPNVRSDNWVDAHPMSINPFASPTATTHPGESSIFPPSPRPLPSRRSQKLKHDIHGMGQGNRDAEFGGFGRLAHRNDAPEMPIGDYERIMGRPKYEPRGRPMTGTGGPWQLPIKGGPHRTPNVTRAPSVPHTPQRGVRYVRRPRRVRPERDAGNEEAFGENPEDTENEEYVMEEDDNADVDEREVR